MPDRRRKLTLAFALFVGVLAFGIVWNGPWKLPEFPHDPAEADLTAEAPAAKTTPEKLAGQLADALKSADQEAGSSPQSPAIDIARIAKDGTSVIAGRAEPNSAVTVLEDGKPVAIAEADDTGTWSITTEHKFSSTDSALSVRPGADEGLKKADGDAHGVQRAPVPEGPSGTQTATERLLSNLEDMVKAAREEVEKQLATPPQTAPAPQTPSSTASNEPARAPAATQPQSAPQVAGGVTREAEGAGANETENQVPEDEVAAPAPPATARAGAAGEMPALNESRTAPQTATPAPATPAETASPQGSPAPASPAPSTSNPSSSAAATAQSESASRAAEARLQPVAIPVPITFVYRETTFTPIGERAAALLLEYLKLKKLERISLSGHADERGSADFNMQLSEERLKAVQQFLKSGGYSGTLDLLALGETEPFRGVDRRKTPREELLQLDRRVELRFTR